jgi:hypothetical protein
MDRTVTVPAYVEIAFAEVIRAFAHEEQIAELLDAATVYAFPPGSTVRLRSSPPEVLTRSSARVRLAWEFIDPRGRPFEGGATIQLLVLQSGNEPLTELLVTTTIDDRYAHGVAIAVHRFMDGLVSRLAGAIRTGSGPPDGVTSPSTRTTWS